MTMASAAVHRANGNGRGNGRVTASVAAPKANGRAAPAISGSNSGSSSSGDDSSHGADGKSKSTSKSARRTEQNRSAQRAFRERRMMYIKTLEEQLSKVADELANATRVREENSELVRLIRDLQRENETLRRVLQQDGGSGADGYADSPETTSSVETRTLSSTGSDTVPTSLPENAQSSLDDYEYQEVLSDDLGEQPVYDVDKLKYEVGDEGSPAYAAVFAHLTPDGRLRPVDGLVAPGDEDDDGAGEVFAPFAAAPSEAAALDGLSARPFAIKERLSSDVGSLAGPPPPLFPLVTPPLSDVSTPGYSQGLLGFDLAPREPAVFFDDTEADNEVPSLRFSSAGDLLTPPNDGTPTSVGTPVAVPVGGAPAKRHLDESDLYVAPGDLPAQLKRCEEVVARSRLEHGSDPVEEELCEKLRQKAMLGHVDPSELNKSKFIKRSAAA